MLRPVGITSSGSFAGLIEDEAALEAEREPDDQRSADGQEPGQGDTVPELPIAECRPPDQIQVEEERIRRATVIDESEIDTEEVGVGAVVHVKDQRSGDSQKFQIVGSAEANPTEHKLSNESPIGKALLGSKRNEVVTVETPRGPRKKLKITKIEAA